ncbi:hypothetical protein WN48_07815 [Eufriesea mexicana]|uniref:Uncharacterized protein n=1 Tax=Eufriesea mexicana TaxID=516756 RepID=A0A310SJ58_9HYME|nr:hypothetical protein WN48_07815 [Eufriesea mexicana]
MEYLGLENCNGVLENWCMGLARYQCIDRLEYEKIERSQDRVQKDQKDWKTIEDKAAVRKEIRSPLYKYLSRVSTWLKGYMLDHLDLRLVSGISLSPSGFRLFRGALARTVSIVKIENEERGTALIPVTRVEISSRDFEASLGVVYLTDKKAFD